MLLCASKSFATAQTPDYLFYDGEKFPLHVNPLEEYFEKYPEKRLKDAPVSSGLWRGYVATFEFTNTILTLKNMVTREWNGKETIETSVIDTVFPDQKDRNLIWYSGLLVFPLGKMKNYVHLSYASEYEKYHILKIVNGKFVTSKEYSLEEYNAFKSKMFKLYKKTEHYKTQYVELSKEFKNSNEVDGFLYQMGDFYQYINVKL